MSWNWCDGTNPEHVLAQGFPSQAEAEAWLAEGWEDLLDDGVAAVSLREGERHVYGPMPLTPED